MSASFYLLILVVLIQRISEAAPVMDYDDPPSGVLMAISGVAPVSVPRSKLDIQNMILKEIRRRVDQIDVSELDSSVRDDIYQDQLSPTECVDKYGIRDGALKHFIRGIRDVGGVLVKDVETLGKGKLAGLPLVPNVINGVGETLQYILCGVEDAASDIVSDGLVEGANLLTQVLIYLLNFEGSAPLKNVPAGIMNITKLLGKVGFEAVEDIFHGIENGVEDLVAEVTSGVQGVVNDVNGAVSEVETDVANLVTDVTGIVNGVHTDVSSVVNNVDAGVGKIVGELGSGVGNIVGGLKSGLGTVKGVVKDDLLKDVEGAVSGVETDVTSVVNAVDTAVQAVKGEVGSGVGNIVSGLEGAVSGVETGVTSVVNAVDTAVQMIKGGVGSGVGSIVGGLKGGLGTITGLLR